MRLTSLRSLSSSEFFWGEKGTLSSLIYHYRWLFPLSFLCTSVLAHLISDEQTRIAPIIYTSFGYCLYLICIERYKYRTACPSFSHRIVRVNIDLIYISVGYALLPYGCSGVSLLFIVPLISALNYRRNRNYYTFATIILVYIAFSDFCVTPRALFNASFYVNLFTYAVVLFGIASSLFLFDKSRLDTEQYSERIRRFYHSVKLSDYYATTLKNLVQELYTAAEADFVTLTFVNKSKNELFVVEAAGSLEKQRIPRQSVNQGIVGQCFRECKPVVANDVGRNKNYYPVEKSTLSEAAFPVVVNKTLIGVINFESKRLDHFDGTVLAIIELVMDHVVALLRNAYDIYDTEKKLKGRIDTFRENSLFLRQLAHEIRNSLNSLVQLPDYIKRTKQEEWKPYLICELAEDQVKSIDRFTLGLNKAIEGRDIYSPEFRDWSVKEIFDEIESRLFFSLAKNLINLNLYDVPERNIRTDKEYVVSIITNIVANSVNAYKRTSTRDAKDDQKNVFKSVNIQVGLDPNETDLIVCIEDYAGGVPQELAAKMSDPSVHTVGNRNGLNIIKRYIANLGGSVKYECFQSIEKLGTRVYLTVPLSNKGKDIRSV